MNDLYNIRDKKVATFEIPDFLSREEVVLLLKFLQKKKSNLRPLIQLAFESGLRFKELISLKNRNIKRFDKEFYIVKFSRSKRRINNNDFIYVHKDLLTDIRKYYNKNSSYIFTSLDDKKLPNYYTCRYWIRQGIYSISDIPVNALQGVGFHITRRTFMTVGVMDGYFSFEEGSRNLGHTSLKITEKHYFFLRRNQFNSRVNYFKKGDK